MPAAIINSVGDVVGFIANNHLPRRVNPPCRVAFRNQLVRPMASFYILPITAVPQLLYSETTAIKWHFPQENATLHNARKSTLIVEPL
jgi:hypothetical protein